MSRMVLYFLHSAPVLSFHIGIGMFLQRADGTLWLEFGIIHIQLVLHIPQRKSTGIHLKATQNN